MDNNENYIIHPDGYNLFAIAMVQQAAEDYRTEYRRYCRSRSKKKSSRLIEVEDWLQNGEGSLYSFGKGVVIMQLIREDVDRQMKNGRGPNRPIEYNGVTKTFSEWADEYGIDPRVLGVRLSSGWSMEKALNTKVVRRGKNRDKNDQAV